MRLAPATTPAACPSPHAGAEGVVRGVQLASAVLGGFLLLVFAPPFLPDAVRIPLEQAFSLVCHRLPDRSFHLHGVALGVCHRDTGIFAGLFVAALLYPWTLPLDRRAGHRAPRVLALAGLPLALDWALGAFGIWANTPFSRTATGLLFGLVAGTFLTRGFVEMTTPAPPLSPPSAPRSS